MEKWTFLKINDDDDDDGTDSTRRGRPNRGDKMVEAMARGQHFYG